MPSKDYNAEMKRYRKIFFNNKNISKKNKDLVKKYMVSKESQVSDARQSIIYRFLPFVLERVKDIEKDMHDRDKIHKVFNKIKKEISPTRKRKLSPSIFNTIINVTKTLCRYYNDDVTPKGFRGLKTDSQGDKRKLQPSDMVTWEDGLKLISFTNDIQIKAIVMTQLDGGFRPSEFVDLNYGDVTIDGDIISVYVRDGKTGSRTAQLYRSCPFLIRWLNEHPTKRKKDPLWMLFFKGEWSRYKYNSINMRVRRLGEEANRQLGKDNLIEKPLDFYNLRHSACVLAKIDNLPTDLAAAKFGHSVKFYSQTYGRLSVQDSINRMRKAYGVIKEEEKKEVNKRCPKCGFINEPYLKHCEKCNSPLTIQLAIKEQEKMTALLSAVKEIQEKLGI